MKDNDVIVTIGFTTRSKAQVMLPLPQISCLVAFDRFLPDTPINRRAASNLVDRGGAVAEMCGGLCFYEPTV